MSLLTSATKVDMQVYRIVNNYFAATVVCKNVIASLLMHTQLIIDFSNFALLLYGSARVM